MRKCGVYCITSKIDNKRYIGKSINITSRMADHFKKLKTNKHFNRHLQNAYNKYGRANFSYIILELSDIENLSALEGKYIKELNVVEASTGYNFKTEDNGFSKHSEETILLMRNLKKKNSKMVYGFSKDGFLVKDWNSISSCAKELKVSPCDVRRTINEEQIFCRGLILNNRNKFRIRENRRKFNSKNFLLK